ncbi:MAG: hypothetical protein M1305_00525 [Candidatus Marsarchaeota archaeon]|nr:hypothetical protein [Candidatus Marsarchaeota archaeon]
MSPQPYKPLIIEPKPYSFDLHPDMIKLLADEFNPRQIARSFAKSGGNAEEVFGSYGVALAKRSVELGEEYPDRTYEVLKEMLVRTKGAYKFPLIPQRLLEATYLSTQGILTLPILVNNPSRFTYQLVDCAVSKAIREESGESVAAGMPCRYACLGFCEELYKRLDISVDVAMEASMAKDGYCQFTIKPRT